MTQDQQTPTQTPQQALMATFLQNIVPIGAIIAFFGFFAPWIGCGFMEFSAKDLVFGIGDDLGDLSNTNDGGNSYILLIVPLAAIAIFALYLRMKKKNALRKSAVPIIVCAALSLGVMAMKYMDVQELKSGFNEKMSESSESTTDKSTESIAKSMENIISVRWGFWMTAIAFISCIAGAVQLRKLQEAENQERLTDSVLPSMGYAGTNVSDTRKEDKTTDDGLRDGRSDVSQDRDYEGEGDG